MKLQTPYYAIHRLSPSGKRCSICDKSDTHLEFVELEPFYPVSQLPDCDKALICSTCLPQAELYFDKVKECFRAIDHLLPLCATRWVENDEEINFNHIGWDVSLPITITQLMRDARHNFLFGFFTSSIVGISSAVELALNYDTRINRPDRTYRWNNLNMSFLRSCQEIGINIEDLLEQDESLDGEKIKFLCRRNKFAHGDVREWSTSDNPMINEDFMEIESVAQLKKGQEFIRHWAKSEGKPPVISADNKVIVSAHSNVLNVGTYNELIYR